jgi:tetratricopeptide (TPR) repeat protein
LDVDSLLREGCSLAKKGLNFEAIACFDHASKITEQNFAPWQCKGFLLEQMGQVGGALNCFEKAIKLARDNPVSWQCKGDVLFCLSRFQEAKECFEKAIELEPNNEYTRSMIEEARCKLNSTISH